MNYTVEEINISDDLIRLELDNPIGITIMPENLEAAATAEQFIFSEPATQINKIFKLNQLPVQILGGQFGALRSRKSVDVFLPAIFFGASLLSENSTVISVALNVLSNYVTDFLKGSFGQSQVTFEIYTETQGKKKIQKISYKGSPEGIKELGEVVEKLSK